LQSLYLALALAAFLVYVVMASIFESFIQPFFIMFSLPFAFIGAAWSLYWLNISLNVMVLIGGVMLAGIVVNNAIVLVDKINQLRRQEGMELKKAILEGVSIRFRPILMTTLTTIFGLLPLALGVGEGAELRKPLAITVLTGLISSTLLTLIIIPLIYGLWEGLMEKHDPKTQSTHPNP
ncbi:MAG: efflux RND transporter permease subunit, partial [Planctomycetota bacterium]